ncbi:uncharacterized protein LOC107699481 [Sinocyclocheilus anshuiensis]|uniref:uncharacterized protein LOC107699481 n=1 Tax=Sinocyclocheilus anshuiensis TaxID=1608454 RepID=UPI0007BA2C38|nr:PREDICTED: uncharacterized protein LOC107699481 [Sinocyclocheilus anshuiensis]
MALSLPPPEPFLPHAGEPVMPWERWYVLFQTYLVAAGLYDVPDGRKRALLLHCLGAEGLRIFQTLYAANTYSEAVAQLKGHFQKTHSVLLKRLHFRQRCQQSSVSASQFVVDLKSLVEPCKFGALRDELIRDQLIEKTNSARVRERLLMENYKLILDKALTQELQIEEATWCAAKIAETNAAKTDVTSVPANTVMDEEFQPAGAIIQQTQPQSSQQRRRCGNCGSIRHANRSPDCPAISQKCRHGVKLNQGCKVVQIKVQFAAFTSSNSYSWSSLSHFLHMWCAAERLLHFTAS